MTARPGDGVALGALVDSARLEFAEAGLSEAALDARLLICAAAGAEHAELVADGERMIAGCALVTAEAFVARRIAGEPVSRILGRREFWSLPFEITEATLDPRADSETLIDAVLEVSDRLGWRERALRICDLGTGSGCLLAALLKEFPQATGLGVDRSENAVAAARRNAAALGLGRRADFVCSDWSNPVSGRFDVVVSNPPYIPSGEIAGLEREVRDHDPRTALDGGADGLDAYRRIAGTVADILGPGGWLFLEIGVGQGRDVQEILRLAGAVPDTGLPPVVHDLAGRARCVRAMFAKPGTVYSG